MRTKAHFFCFFLVPLLFTFRKEKYIILYVSVLHFSRHPLPTLQHHFLLFGGQGCGDVGRWFRLRSGCRTVKKNEHSTALPPRITRIARIINEHLTAQPPRITHIARIINEHLTAQPPRITRIARIINEHLTALSPRITRIARITILVIREIRGGKTREIRGG